MCCNEFFLVHVHVLVHALSLVFVYANVYSFTVYVYDILSILMFFQFLVCGTLANRKIWVKKKEFLPIHSALSRVFSATQRLRVR